MGKLLGGYAAGNGNDGELFDTVIAALCKAALAGWDKRDVLEAWKEALVETHAQREAQKKAGWA